MSESRKCGTEFMTSHSTMLLYFFCSGIFWYVCFFMHFCSCISDVNLKVRATRILCFSNTTKCQAIIHNQSFNIFSFQVQALLSLTKKWNSIESTASMLLHTHFSIWPAFLTRDAMRKTALPRSTKQVPMQTTKSKTIKFDSYKNLIFV